jgi:hypothetical protein
MFNRVMLVALTSMLVLSLAGCGGGEQAQQASEPAAAPAPPAKAPEQPVEIYELTKDDITSHKDWTSRNISILGAKLGDKTREVEKAFGSVENTRTLPEDYLTVYQGNGLFVYTFKLTGKARRFEVNEVLAKKIADEKLKKLLSSGDLKYMRQLFGMEEGVTENTEDNATEYAYDSRGFRFVKFKVGGKTVNALRLMEMKKSTT